MRARTRRCLAISTVVGNMLMILITLSLAAILVAWAGTSYGAFSSGSSLFFQQRGQALQERVVVEAAFFLCGSPGSVVTCGSSNPRSGFLDMFIRNVGVEQVNVVAIYINSASNSPGTYVISPCTKNTDNSVTLYIGSGNPTYPNVCEFQIISQSWSAGAVFTILAATSRGNQAAQTVRAP